MLAIVYAQQFSHDSLDLKGRPVLFVYGHQGGFTQIGVYARRAYYDCKDLQFGQNLIGFKQSLDFFTIDFGASFSAFSHEVVKTQAAFVQSVSQLILEKYDSGVKLRLLGHSMGGVVIRLALASCPEGMAWRDRIDFVITLATPHLTSPVPYTYALHNLWYELANKRVEDMTISIDCGTADMIVAPEITLSKYHLSTTNWQDVGVGCDHVSILFCPKIASAVTKLIDSEDIISELSNMDKETSKNKEESINSGPIILNPSVFLPGKWTFLI